jgi:hypothetical protein
MQSTLGARHNVHTETTETTQKTTRGYYLRSTATNMGFNPVATTITLTDQRLVIAPERQRASPVGFTFAAMGVLKPVAFPLCHIRNVEVYPKTVWGKRDVLRIEFDNDGREYLWVQPAQEWQAALMAARATAADMPFSTLPAIKNGVEASSMKSAGKLILVTFGVVMALMLVCIVAGAIVGLMR